MVFFLTVHVMKNIMPKIDPKNNFFLKITKTGSFLIN